MQHARGEDPGAPVDEPSGGRLAGQEQTEPGGNLHKLRVEDKGRRSFPGQRRGRVIKKTGNVGTGWSSRRMLKYSLDVLQQHPPVELFILCHVHSSALHSVISYFQVSVLYNVAIICLLRDVSFSTKCSSIVISYILVLHNLNCFPLQLCIIYNLLNVNSVAPPQYCA